MPNPRIMIVEDERIIAMDVRNRLQKLGYQVVASVVSGADAIAKAQECRPDVVLMDIRIEGDMDGVDTAEHIRTRLDIPVIYLTAYADDATLARAKITEPYGYLTKPFEERAVYISVEMALYRHAMEGRLKDSERWMSTTLKSIGDGVIATDPQGCVKFMNPVAEALTGWRQADALGQDISRVLVFVNEPTQVMVESPPATVLRSSTEAVLPRQTVLIAADGTAIPVEARATPIRGDTGQMIGAVLVLRDVTTRRRAEEAMSRYTRDLEARNEELDAFADAVARDLQRPITHLSRMAHDLVMNRPSLSAGTVTGYLQNIVRLGDRMRQSVAEMLLLSSLRRAQIKTEPLDMAAIVAGALDRLAAEIDDSKAEFVVTSTWPAAVGYAPWIEEVWVQYLRNAIKHGGLPPRAGLGAADEGEGRVRFWVQDNGNGLLAQEQARAFHATGATHDTGPLRRELGLVLVRRIVERLGGQVSVMSDGVPGRGCLFSFVLPAGETEDSL